MTIFKLNKHIQNVFSNVRIFQIPILRVTSRYSGPEDGNSRYVSPKRWYLPTSPHGVTTQKTNTVTLTTVRTYLAIKHSS
jgi:hypothetical protein